MWTHKCGLFALRTNFGKHVYSCAVPALGRKTKKKGAGKGQDLALRYSANERAPLRGAQHRSEAHRTTHKRDATHRLQAHCATYRRRIDGGGHWSSRSHRVIFRLHVSSFVSIFLQLFILIYCPLKTEVKRNRVAQPSLKKKPISHRKRQIS